MPTVPSSGGPPSLPGGQHHTRLPGLKRGPAAAAGASRPVEPAGGTVLGGLGSARKSSVDDAMLSRLEPGASAAGQQQDNDMCWMQRWEQRCAGS